MPCLHAVLQGAKEQNIILKIIYILNTLHFCKYFLITPLSVINFLVSDPSHQIKVTAFDVLGMKFNNRLLFFKKALKATQCDFQLLVSVSQKINKIIALDMSIMFTSRGFLEQICLSIDGKMHRKYIIVIELAWRRYRHYV